MSCNYFTQLSEELQTNIWKEVYNQNVVEEFKNKVEKIAHNFEYTPYTCIPKYLPVRPEAGWIEHTILNITSRNIFPPQGVYFIFFYTHIFYFSEIFYQIYRYSFIFINCSTNTINYKNCI